MGITAYNRGSRVQLPGLGVDLTTEVRGEVISYDGSAWTNTSKAYYETRDYDTFAAAIASIGSTMATLVVAETIAVSASVAIPTTMTLKPTNGAYLAIATGVTLTINGTLDAPLRKVFDCTGTGKVVFGAGAMKEVYPEWWGTNTTPGTTDMTAAVQAAITAAGNAIVSLASTTYAVTGLTVSVSTRIKGASWSNQGTVLLNTSTTSYCLSIINADYTGSVITDVCVKGSATSGGGIYIEGEGQTTLRNVYVLSMGAIGIEIVGHASIISIDRCRIQHCTLDGIYGRTEPAHQINSVDINSCEINDNHGSGINLWANSLRITNNTIQGNDGAGVLLTASDMATGESTMSGCLILGNYFEANYDGEIVGITEYNAVGPIEHYCQSMFIIGNWISLDVAGHMNPANVAQIDLDGTNADSTEYAGLYIGPNNFAGDLPWINLNGISDSHSVIHLDYPGGTLSDKYLGLGWATITGTAFLKGAGAPATNPQFVGQWYFDTTNEAWYRGVHTTDPGHWRLVGGGASSTHTVADNDGTNYHHYIFTNGILTSYVKNATP
jgi:hypothetical protein